MHIEKEKEILEAGYPGIVPFLMREERGEVSFEIYSGIEKEAIAFQKAFEGRYFTPKALTSISQAIDPYLSSIGYTRDDKGTLRYYDQYELSPSDQVNTALFKESTAHLTEKLLERLSDNLTTFSLEALLERGLESFVTVIEGRVVAIAAVNERLEEGGAPELTVETAVAYRHKGYGAACVAALAEYLVKKGSFAEYCCRHTHTASGRLARSVGFQKIGRFYAIAAYKN